MVKIPLNKSRYTSERYYLIDGSMGSAGKPNNSPNRKYEIANGIDRGNGYQGYMAVDYALNSPNFPEDAKTNLIKELRKLGYNV